MKTKNKLVKYDKNIMKSVPVYKGYYADINGNIYSAWVTGKDSHIDTNKLKKLIPRKLNNNNYLHISLRVEKGKYFTTTLHRIICMTFHGLPPTKKYTASHLDGNCLNNKSLNLMWETQKDNLLRKKLHGTDDIGYKNSRAKINKDVYNKIIKLLELKKYTHKEIGELFGLSRVFITKINCKMRYNF
jgi:hypothetical protein